MESAVGAASWLLGKAITKLSDELVAAFMSSSELGHNFQSIKLRLTYTLGLLQEAQRRDMRNSDGSALQSLLADLSKKADEAEDVLDEIHYFLIQDQLDGTIEAAVQEPATPHVGDVLRAHARDGRHAVRHTVGNCLQCFCFCSPTNDGDSAAVNITTKSHTTAMRSSGNDSHPIDKLPFNRVAMSNRIKSIVEEMNSICEPVSNLLNIANQSSTATSTTVTLNRPTTGSIVVHDKLLGRSATFEQIVTALTCGTYHAKTLSVLPLVGPGGIGKTTFTQHLCNDKRIEAHFTVKVWVCVSTDFDVLKLTQQIHSCIPPTEKEDSNSKNETSNLDQLQKSIADRLKSKRFLVVLDDIWKCNSESDWNNLLAPFRKGEIKGSMVLVTTRFPFIAHMVKTTHPVELKGLDPDVFFELFEACIFGDSKPADYEDGVIDVARNISKKLKGSPLAANTVGRLLKNLPQEYWVGVLEKNEWLNAKGADDIMPSLKISYDYLPFLLKKCFSYCAIFPEDYKFYNLEITSFWTAIGILDSSYQNGKNYLEELVDNGFLLKGVDRFEDGYYVMHDLFHELSQNVSSQECLNISSLSFSADNIPHSIRHLSITTEDIYDESFDEEMGKLKSNIDIGNLRTLMIFGLHDKRIANILKDTFEEIKSLRVLFIAMNTPESLPNKFSNLIHLQYLQIRSPYRLNKMTLPSTLPRFYHLKFLDLENWCGSKKMPKDFSRLVNLRYFSSSKELLSNIPEVGKMKCLHELKEFYVKKESTGFELRELGELTELGGGLTLRNLETVASKGEASAAKLKNKKNLQGLKLVWGTEHQTIDDDVLEGLQPHANLRVLGIINPGVASCPRWLCVDISTKRLESVHLERLSWCPLPAFEQLPHLSSLTLKNIAGMSVFGPGFGGVTERSFMHLKKLEFEDMPELEKWVEEPNSRLFSRLESIKLGDCPLLCSFPLLECSDHFTNLCKLDIVDCPKLTQFPPMPHNYTLTYIRVRKDCTSQLLYTGKELTIKEYNNALIFYNMHDVEAVKIMQNSTRCLELSIEMADSVALPSVRNLAIEKLCITGELFSKVLKCFPALSQLAIEECKSLELLPVEDGGLSGLEMLQSFTAYNCGKLFSRWPKGEVGEVAHVIKPFPTSLRELDIFLESSMQSMGLLSNLTSLTGLSLKGCEELTMDGFDALITANLKKFTVNAMYSEQDQNISIAGDLLSEIARSKLMHAGSFQLEKFEVDSIWAVLTVPICSHLAASLHTLEFSYDQRATTFTEEQEQALQLLTSLQNLRFWYCENLRSLPQGLRGLSSLKALYIDSCEKIHLLPPKEGFPASLQTLEVEYCSPKLTEQAKKLKGRDPWFLVEVEVLD